MVQSNALVFQVFVLINQTICIVFRWHVRTKENIARVRKDEAEAAEKERQERLRIENADREARLNVLKNKSKQKLVESGIAVGPELEATLENSGHVNLFSDLEHAVQTSNRDHDKEEKEKKEEYEKKIGYLTYLGQDTNEALGKKNWYDTLPDASRFSRSSEIKATYDKLVLKDADGKPKPRDLDIKDGEVSWKAKQRLDPLNAFKKYCHSTKKTEKAIQEGQSKSSKEYVAKDTNNKCKRKPKNIRKDEKLMKLQKLREARLKREQLEKSKTEKFLAGLNGTLTEDAPQPIAPKVKPKYNSQFNPALARQNFTSY